MSNDILKVLEYGFNPSKLVNDMYFKNADNYRMHKAIQGTQIPVWSWWSGGLVGKMEDEEQLRYVSDLAKNTGINPDNWKYPIRMGYYGNVSGYSTALARANKGIMKLYKTTTKKPTEIHNHNTNYIKNYGNYYRYKW